jgi:hypothetical protein
MTTKTESVTLVAEASVQITEDLTLPPGRYQAKKTQIGVPMRGGAMNWMPPEYEIQIPEDQVSNLTGKKPIPHVISTPYDVTQAVALGKLKPG